MFLSFPPRFFKFSRMERFANKKYVVDSLLRNRPDGIVYRAHRVSDGVFCAIKELDVRHMSEEEQDDAMEEIRVLATVHNENMISYFDSFVEESKLYVVMEYCDEADLGRHIKTRAEQQKFFNEAQVWSYLIQMLRGLVAVHSKGLIHRNVRPGNIIRLDSNTVKLGDVRVGKLLKEGSAAIHIENPHYVPPEVWENKAYTFKSDIWAVGCVLYEMITLVVPFGGCALPDLRLKVVEGLYQPIPSSFSSGLNSVLKLLFNPDQATRISARDLLVHPVLQPHLQCAPAPAPSLRVRASRGNSKLGQVAVHLSIPMKSKNAHPTVAKHADKHLVHKPTQNLKQGTTLPSASRRQSGLLNENPAATAVVSKVAPLLAPRAILSSPDNDEMLSELNRPSNQAPKVKVPRVAMLGKVIPKTPSGTTVIPPVEGLPFALSPCVNLKHFKTAYIQTPKIASDEFPAVNTPLHHDSADNSRMEKLDNPGNAPVTTKIKSTSTPAKLAAPRREKSAESGRSISSSRSDESLIRVRAPIDGLDSSHIESATRRREHKVESAPSVTSSRSGDSVTRLRTAMDISEAPHAIAPTNTGDASESDRSMVSSNSGGSAISVRLTISDLDSAQPPLLTDELPSVHPAELLCSFNASKILPEELEKRSFTPVVSNTSPITGQRVVPTSESDRSQGSIQSLAGDGVKVNVVEDSADHVRDDDPDSAQRLHESELGTESLSSDGLRVGALDPSAPISMASTIKPVPSDGKVTTPRSGGVARKHSVTSAFGARAPVDVSDRRLPNPARNRRLSFDGTRKVELEEHDVSMVSKTNPVGSHTSVLTPRGENLKVSSKSVAGDIAATEHFDGVNQVGVQDNLSAQRLQKCAGNRRLSLDGMRKEKLESSPASPMESRTRPLIDHTKVISRRGSSSDLWKLAAGDTLATKDSGDSATSGRSLASSKYSGQVTPKSRGCERPPVDGTRKKVPSPGDLSGLLTRKPLTTSGKGAKDSRDNSAESSRSVPTAALARRKNSAYPPTMMLNDRAKKQADDSAIGVSTSGSDVGQSPQKSMRSRRLSLDFSNKGKEIQPSRRGMGHISGATKAGAN